MCLVSIFRQFVETRNCDEKIIESQTFCENVMAALCKLQLDFRYQLGKGTGKRGHIVADTCIVAYDVSWAAQTGKHLLRTQNVSEQNQKHFFCPGHTFCVRNKCCARGQTGKHLCRQQCVLVCKGLNTQTKPLCSRT